MRVVISEFMDEAAVAALAAQFDVAYDRDLVDRRDDLCSQVAEADCLIVRNRTQVDAPLLANGAANSRSSDAWAWASTTSTPPPLPRAASK